MKKIIESRFGLAGIFLLVNLATLFVPNFLGRLIILIGIFVSQIIFEIYYDGLEWKDNDAKFNEDVKRNLAFNFSKWLAMMNFVYCGLVFNAEINSHSIVWPISFVVISLIFMLLFYIRESSYERPSYIDVLIVPLVISIALSTYLNFDTQFIWMPISLFLIGGLFGIFDELLLVILKKWNEILFNKIVLTTIASLILTGIISSLIEFWSTIISFLLIPILQVSLWIWLAFVITLVVGFFVIDHLTIQNNKKRIALALRQKIEAEKQAEIERVAKIKQEKEDRIKDLSRIPTGHPMETFDGDLVFIAKLYNSGELDDNFQFSKILKIPLKNLVSVSHEKRQIVYDQNIIEALKMYNSLYEKIFADWFLKNMLANFIPFCNFLEEFKDYKGVNYLKEQIKQICSGMHTCCPKFFQE